MEGKWAGELIKPPYDIPIAVTFSTKKDVLSAVFHNPAQGAANYPIDSVRRAGDSVFLSFDNIHINLLLVGHRLEGVWIQGDSEDSVLFEKGALLRRPKRPQTPLSPFPYRLDTVTFASRTPAISLEGSLTKPEENSGTKAVVLLTGSGPQNRDEEILLHRPFALLADRLTRAGIAVLRYDDRGMGNSGGIHGTASSLDFAMDAAGAYDYLSGLGYSHIGFLGHSEGGIIAQIADSLVKGASFHIYLASPGLPIADLMVEQNRLVLQDIYPDSLLKRYLRLIDEVFQAVKSGDPLSKKQAYITRIADDFYRSTAPNDQNLLGPSGMAFTMRFTQLLYLKWWMYFLSYEPAIYLKQIAAPILAINGSEDIQVTPDNLGAIAAEARNSKEVTVREIPMVNHLMQRCHTCTLLEYGILTETMNEEVLDIIIQWITDLSTEDHD